MCPALDLSTSISDPNQDESSIPNHSALNALSRGTDPCVVQVVPSLQNIYRVWCSYGDGSCKKVSCNHPVIQMMDGEQVGIMARASQTVKGMSKFVIRLERLGWNR